MLKFCVRLFWSLIGCTSDLLFNKHKMAPFSEEDFKGELDSELARPACSYESAIIGPPPTMPKMIREIPNPKKLSFKLYDAFGSTCYDGDSYEEGVKKAKLLPYTTFMKAFNESGEFVGVVWASPETGIMVTSINTLIPN